MAIPDSILAGWQWSSGYPKLLFLFDLQHEVAVVEDFILSLQFLQYRCFSRARQAHGDDHFLPSNGSKCRSEYFRSCLAGDTVLPSLDVLPLPWGSRNRACTKPCGSSFVISTFCPARRPAVTTHTFPSSIAVIGSPFRMRL